MTDWYTMRASDADRERGADLLKAAMAEGRLDWAEYQKRLERLMASKNYGEIHDLVADLPRGISPFPQLQQPQQPPAQPGMYPVAPPPRQADPVATGAIICGALAPFTCGLTSVPAVITGHLALARLSRSDQSGRSMAIAGLVLGYLPLILIVLFVAGLFDISFLF